MSPRIERVDAFTLTPGLGNRAGVVLDASGLSLGEMQAIAARVEASETAFGLPSAEPDAYEVEVRYFSRTREIPLCGHATIAFHYLRALRLGLPSCTVRVKTGAGILPVAIERDEEGIRVTMTQAEPRLLAVPPVDACGPLLVALGLTTADLVPDLPIEVVTTGHAKVLVPIRSVIRLDALRPDSAALLACSPFEGANGFFVFTLERREDDQSDGVLTHGRMFSPATGVNEDSVTGNANGPAGAYLYRHGRIPGASPVVRYRGAQGWVMGRPGIVDVILHVDQRRVVVVQVSGRAVLVPEVL